MCHHKLSLYFFYLYVVSVFDVQLCDILLKVTLIKSYQIFHKTITM